MASYALVRDGRIVNLIEWDGVQPYAPPSDTTLVPIEAVRDATAIAGGVFLPDAEPA